MRLCFGMYRYVTFNHGVAGSNPAELTKYLNDLGFAEKNLVAVLVAVGATHNAE